MVIRHYGVEGLRHHVRAHVALARELTEWISESEDFELAIEPLLNLVCFAACIEGLFFFAAFAYVYFLRSKGLLNGLAAGTNWVFRDESAHMNFAFAVIDVVRTESPHLFDDDLAERIREMMDDQRLSQLGLAQRYGAKNPFDFMELQDVQELTNFFERTVAAYQVGVEGDVSFDEDF